ncbi:MAG TPA: bifunctional phosphoribosyl-AMP cyclohydrolase/phosphoribosyl-ATP diphosphatase HisIE, partial [Kofleriaceae bacterium]|nr:bifunctional phosphoribosyl-AMP cyclohydrolase/phosphoribosyl-ATP diphosphatase HisIE [Kofleriaceae bacterium]
AGDGSLLMLAWMNAEALELTLRTGEAHFWSRSRRALWRKGETSGNTLAVDEIRIDCDADALLLIARPAGPTCHTGARSCFFRRVDGEALADDGGPSGPPAAVTARLQAVLEQRRDDADAGKSYTRSLLDAGMPKILAKIAEEHGELAAELPGGDADAVIHETADLIFHVMVGLVARGLSIEAVWAELGRRFGIGGHVEKASRPRGGD